MNEMYKASDVINDFTGYLGTSKVLTAGMVSYLHQRSGMEASGKTSRSGYETLFKTLVADKIASPTARKGIMKKIRDYKDVQIDFDTEKVKQNSIRFVSLTDRKGASELGKMIDSLGLDTHAAENTVRKIFSSRPAKFLKKAAVLGCLIALGSSAFAQGQGLGRITGQGTNHWAYSSHIAMDYAELALEKDGGKRAALESQFEKDYGAGSVEVISKVICTDENVKSAFSKWREGSDPIYGDKEYNESVRRAAILTSGQKAVQRFQFQEDMGRAPLPGENLARRDLSHDPKQAQKQLKAERKANREAEKNWVKYSKVKHSVSDDVVYGR